MRLRHFLAETGKYDGPTLSIVTLIQILFSNNINYTNYHQDEEKCYVQLKLYKISIIKTILTVNFTPITSFNHAMKNVLVLVKFSAFLII
jgi:hypothetical protein